MLNLDPQEVALFIVAQGAWQKHHRPDVPKSYKVLSLDPIKSGYAELLAELQKLLPNMMVGSTNILDPDEPALLYADPKDIGRWSRRPGRHVL